MKPTLGILTMVTVNGLLWAGPSGAATLSPIQPPVVISGASALSANTSWGAPGPFWVVPLVDWEQTEEVTLSVSVSVPSGDPGFPVGHIVFLTARNSTPDTWQSFEIAIEGSAAFVSAPPPSAGVLSPTSIQLTDESLVFDGLAWGGQTRQPGPGMTTTISFGIDVTPPNAGQPVVLTFRPIPIPEPGTSLLLGSGWLLFGPRRRKHG